MKNKRGSVLKSFLGIVLVLVIWQMVSDFEIVPKFVLPSPTEIVSSMVENWDLLIFHTKTTLTEAMLGLGIGVGLGFGLALWMELVPTVYDMFYPLLIISQTIPTIAIAPLFVLWFGYGILPKVIIVVISSLFPITIGLLDGFKFLDPDIIHLLKSMKATDMQVIRYAKLPHARGYFFSSLRIAVTYAIVGAVVAEWLGGNSGLGVYMTRARKSYAYDEMFAIIIFITILSLLLMALVQGVEKLSMPWKKYEEKDW